MVLVKTVDAAEERFGHVWLIDEWDVPVAYKERNDWAGWFGGDSVSTQLALGVAWMFGVAAREMGYCSSGVGKPGTGRFLGSTGGEGGSGWGKQYE